LTKREDASSRFFAHILLPEVIGLTEKRICETFPGGYVVYPAFTPEDGESASAAERMNAFYLTLRDAAIAFASETAASGGSRRYTAEYSCTQAQDGSIRIEYTLRLRRRGRTEAMKTLLHHWQDGLLVPPRKKM